MFTFLAGLFTKGFVGSILNAAVSIIKNRSEAEIQRLGIVVPGLTAIGTAQLEAANIANENRLASSRMFFGSPWFRFIMWCLIAVSALHMILIVLDSSCPGKMFYLFRFDFGWFAIPGIQVGGFQPLTGGCGWVIPKLPPPYDDREWQVLGTLLGIQMVPNVLAHFANIVQAFRR